MKLPPRPLVLGLLVPTIVVAVWVLGGWPHTDESGGLSVEAVVAGPGETRSAAPPPAEPAVPLERDPHSGAEPAPSDTDAGDLAPRRQVVPPGESGPSGSTWIEGRVLLPPGTPPGEDIFVTARPSDPHHGPPDRVRVNADTRFTVAFPHRVLRGHLQLDSRFLYLQSDVELQLFGDLEPVLLEPRLGGAIAGRLVLPPEAPRPGPLRVQLRELPSDGEPLPGSRVLREAVVGEDLRFEFHGLPAERRYSLSCSPDVCLPAESEALKVEVGRELGVELTFEAGATLAGRVLDAGGVPIPGATAVCVGLVIGRRIRRRTETDDGGAFSLRGLPAGQWFLGAGKRGWQPLVRRLGAVGDGETRAGIELVLDRTPFLAGQVLMPDGAPAAGVAVIVGPADGEGAPREDLVTAETDEGGRFEVDELEHERLVVYAILPARPSGERRASLLRERATAGEATLRAVLLDVPVGSTGLILQLEPGYSLTGRVVDQTGAPVQRIRLELEPDPQSPTHRSWSRITLGTQRCEGGAFEIGDLPTGSWNVRANPPGLSPSEVVSVTVPRSGTELVLVVLQPVTVSGLVLDRGGVPAREAQVRLAKAGGGPLEWGDSEASTGTEGCFSFARVSPEPLRIRAVSADGASAGELTLEPRPGDTLRGIVLSFQPPGSIRGQVLDGSGRPTAGVRVYLEPITGSLELNSAETNERGEFHIERVNPGTYEVSAMPTHAAIEGAFESDIDTLAHRTGLDVERLNTMRDLFDAAKERGEPAFPPLPADLSELTDRWERNGWKGPVHPWRGWMGFDLVEALTSRTQATVVSGTEVQVTLEVGTR